MKPVGFAVAAVATIALIPFAAAAAPLETKPINIDVMVCDTPDHAVAYALAIDNGAVDDEAKDVVGRAAGAEVCGKFMGLATVDEEKTVREKGVTYKITAFKFTGVGKMRWSAIPQN
jgi:hypothetical protein